MKVTVSLLLAINLFQNSNGFLPSSTISSSFHGKTLAKSFNARPLAKSVGLEMNLGERFMRVAKANLNSLLQKVEDPEKVLEQAVQDMQADLVKVRQSFAEVSATQKKMERQRDEANRLANEWYGRAQLALQKGDEELAREALSRRQVQVDIFETISGQMNTQGQALDQLRNGMQTLEAKITEAKGKKDTLIARARSAKTSQSVNDMLNNVTGSSGLEAFERMQDKVETLESSAEISSQSASLAGGSLESKFKALEGNSSIESELEKMKSSLLPGSGPSKGSLPSSSSIESELSQLKKDMEK
mmetsp:Transcript_2552/g.3469  ORF Transcript_2552/g.3469 Transcript_2552/m.3469 type:complete len:302 (+) Transcript_2552:1-906(+)|eukprot:CAMPEP_0171478716 /NCGR_PEP_ID=MMETSP0946-20130122/4942_1 /TAXON_ID=109269 /ORGANISM="Vaucheria litorea, Strain CCMP2940" /LENGTH=301 /DNA_ID=CAMNT_0012009403 /DNA_START=1 /DNA_END=906 /DNA_ORIENTATION=+